MRKFNRSVARRMLIAAGASVALVQPAFAADSTWAGTSDMAWENIANWDGGVVPGNNSGSLGSSSDLAFFTGLPPQTTIGVDLNRNIHTLQFGSIAMPDGTTTAFTLGSGGANAGNPIYLSNGGAIQMLSSVVATTDINEGKQIVINAPMTLTGTSYSFISDAGSVALSGTRFGLSMFGTITAGGGAPTTITFSAVAGNSGSSRNENQSQITDGANGAIVSIVKNGPGCWEFNQSSTTPNTYSGDTILNEGTLRCSSTGTFDGLGGFSPNSHYIINSGAVLRNSAAGSTVKAVTINTGGSLSVSTAASTTLNFATNSGPAIHINLPATPSGTFAINGPYNLRGTVPLEGGIKLTTEATTGSITIGASTSVFDLGTVTRVMDIGKGDPLNSFDLRFVSTIVGGGAGAGILKIGPGTLRLDSAANSFTGLLEVREGDVRGNVDNVFGAQTELKITGGNLHVFGAAGSSIQTFGPVSITKGSITAGSTIASTVQAPSFALNVAGGDTVDVQAILADSGSPATLTKTGAGVATLTGANTYTGGTTLSGGTLVVNTNSEDIIIGPGAPGANITRGKLVVDYAGGTSPASTIVPILDAGFDVNFATGQIRSSTAVASQLGLGYNDDGVNNFSVAFTRYGDANLDFITDIGDFALLAANFNTPAGWGRGNFNYDTLTDIGDFALLAANFNQSAPIAGDLPRGGAVPEPTSAIVVLAAAVLLGRSRRGG